MKELEEGQGVSTTYGADNVKTTVGISIHRDFDTARVTITGQYPLMQVLYTDLSKVLEMAAESSGIE